VGPGHEEHLRQALDSVEAQTYRRWELIVVLDVGDKYIYDRKEAFDQLFDAYPYVKWMPSTGIIGASRGMGAGFARNRGAELARAPLLLFLDADDWLYPDFLARTLQAHSETGDAIYTDYMGIADVDDVSKLALPLQPRVQKHDGKRAIITHNTLDFDCNRALRQPADDNKPYLWCNITTLIRTAWHFEIGGFDESMKSWEDWLYWLQMARKGKCFTRIEQPLLVYRFYTGERRDWAHSGQNWEKLVQYIKERLPRKEDDVGCRGCGKSKSVPSKVVAPPTATLERSISMQDADFRMCLYQHPNKGDHMVMSVVKDIGNYGQKADGDRFLVHIADIQAKPGNFIVEEVKIPDLPVQPVAEPVRMSDIDAEIETGAAQEAKMLQIKEEARLAAEAHKETREALEPEVEEEPEPEPDSEPPKKTRRRRVTRKKAT
jgi:glycosyltransferase involved in cell wall biosynthesis